MGFIFQIILGQIEPLTEQQLMAICEVQQATQEAEEALSHGLDALNQSLSDTIASDALSSPTNMANYMGQMAAAMNKLSTLENFVIQVRTISLLQDGMILNIYSLQGLIILLKVKIYPLCMHICYMHSGSI
ncbi:hypothetical protein HanHA300_Chr10g0356141 [Helianthus annuus]|nr:hypothetical protein HanHA300_Chr10g0356141 [Helianthus annuus]KAJ0529426.1 hypothetical protein HanHA89_Chr10g0377731 [Helianthus annuus]